MLIIVHMPFNHQQNHNVIYQSTKSSSTYALHQIDQMKTRSTSSSTCMSILFVMKHDHFGIEKHCAIFDINFKINEEFSSLRIRHPHILITFVREKLAKCQFEIDSNSNHPIWVKSILQVNSKYFPLKCSPVFRHLTWRFEFYLRIKNSIPKFSSICTHNFDYLWAENESDKNFRNSIIHKHLVGTMVLDYFSHSIKLIIE